MSFDQVITALIFLKPVTRLIPIAGAYLESAADLILQGHNYAKVVEANRKEYLVLAECSMRCAIVIIEKALAFHEKDIDSHINTIHQFKRLAEELVQTTQRQAQRNAVSQLWHAAKDKNGITDLRRRFGQIIERFGVGEQGIMTYDIEKAIRKVNELQEAQIRTEQAVLFEKLRPVASARYDHEDAPRGCTENTRVVVRDRIFRWSTNLVPLESVLWLSGSAGTGKTAIMKSLAQFLAAQGMLGGSFFAALQSAERRNPLNIIRSLIYQLSELQPTLRKSIYSIVRDLSAVSDHDETLLISVLLSDDFGYVISKIQQPMVILIDALDECDLEGGQLLPTLIRIILRHSQKLKLIVSSRITPTIHQSFSTVDHRRFQLDNVKPNVVAGDIRLYFETEFQNISWSRGLNLKDPLSASYTSEDITKLVEYTQGVFFFAFAIVTWLGDDRYLPQDRLRQILQWQPHDDSHSLQHPLDHLYGLMLQASLGFDPKHHVDIAQRIQRLLEFLVVAFQPLTISELAVLLDCEEDVVHHDLSHFSAVLYVPKKGSAEAVVIYHTSFIDYLINSLRCPSSSLFHVAKWEAHGRMGTRCLDLSYDHRSLGRIGNTTMNPGNAAQNPLYYTSRRWKDHLRLSPFASGYVLSSIDKARKIVSESVGDMDALHDLSDLLEVQSERTIEIAVLHESISINRKLVDSLSSSHPTKQDQYLENLAEGLWALYQRSGYQQIIDQAVQLYRQVLQLRPPGHAQRGVSLNNLANGLLSLYQRSRGIWPLLDEAIQLHRQALQLHPLGHPERASSLGNLANGLLELHGRTWGYPSLNEAIQLGRQALELRPPGHPNRDISLNNLACALRLLYVRPEKQVEALDEATQLGRQALELCPPGHPRRITSLHNLASILYSSYPLNKDISVIEEAVRFAREVQSLCPTTHRNRPTYLRGLGHNLKVYGSVSGDQALVLEAEQLFEQADALERAASR